MLEDLQLLEQYKAGRVGRRLEHGVAAIVDCDRLLFLGHECFEIASPDQSPGRVETGGQPPRQPAAIEGFGAVGGDLFEGAGEIGLDDRSAEARRFAVGEKSRGRCAGR